jgi:Domain of unknown function (DUF6268)
MSMKIQTLVSLALAAPFAAHGQDLFSTFPTQEAELHMNVGADGAKGASSDGLDLYSAYLSTRISDPVALGAGWRLLPTLTVEESILNGVLPGNVSLTKVSAPLYFLHQDSQSRWIYNGWVDPALSSDLQHVTAQDVFLTLGGGVSYQWSKRLMVGASVGVTDIMGAPRIMGGPSLAWSPVDDVAFSIFGPTAKVTWSPVKDWKFSIGVRSESNAWNVDVNDNSRNLYLRSFSGNLMAEHDLGNGWWVQGGIGTSFANKVKITDGEGKREMADMHYDNGLNVFLGVKRYIW